jgi:hypothetical protein
MSDSSFVFGAQKSPDLSDQIGDEADKKIHAKNARIYRIFDPFLGGGV